MDRPTIRRLRNATFLLVATLSGGCGADDAAAPVCGVPAPCNHTTPIQGSWKLTERCAPETGTVAASGFLAMNPDGTVATSADLGLDWPAGAACATEDALAVWHAGGRLDFAAGPSSNDASGARLRLLHLRTDGPRADLKVASLPDGPVVFNVGFAEVGRSDLLSVGELDVQLAPYSGPAVPLGTQPLLAGATTDVVWGPGELTLVVPKPGEARLHHVAPSLGPLEVVGGAQGGALAPGQTTDALDLAAPLALDLDSDGVVDVTFGLPGTAKGVYLVAEAGAPVLYAEASDSFLTRVEAEPAERPWLRIIDASSALDPTDLGLDKPPPDGDGALPWVQVRAAAYPFGSVELNERYLLVMFGGESVLLGGPGPAPADGISLRSIHGAEGLGSIALRPVLDGAVGDPLGEPLAGPGAVSAPQTYPAELLATLELTVDGERQRTLWYPAEAPDATAVDLIAITSADAPPALLLVWGEPPESGESAGIEPTPAPDATLRVVHVAPERGPYVATLDEESPPAVASLSFAAPPALLEVAPGPHTLTMGPQAAGGQTDAVATLQTPALEAGTAHTAALHETDAGTPSVLLLGEPMQGVRVVNATVGVEIGLGAAGTLANGEHVLIAELGAGEALTLYIPPGGDPSHEVVLPGGDAATLYLLADPNGAPFAVHQSADGALSQVNVTPP